MLADLPPPTEIVHTLSEEEQKKKVSDHFDLLYIILSESKLAPNAKFEVIDGLKRGVSGITYPFHNGIIGCPKEKKYDQVIKKQLKFFESEKLPFVWYVDDDTDESFKEALLSHGFEDPGIFRGVMGALGESIPESKIPENATIELVKDANGMEEFNELVANTFGFFGENKEKFAKAMWNASIAPSEKAFHWVLKLDGKVVSALTTIIDGDVVSFWNGATLPDHRKKGYSTAIRRFALKDAYTTGCRYGVSYLMSDAMAYGICKKLGFKPSWNFRAYIAPVCKASNEEA